MTRDNLIEKLTEKINSGNQKAKIYLSMGNRKMYVETISMGFDPEDGHINGNVHLEENGEVITQPIVLMQVLDLCKNPAISIDNVY